MSDILTSASPKLKTYDIEVQGTVVIRVISENEAEAIEKVFCNHFAAQMSFDSFKQIISIQKVIL